MFDIIYYKSSKPKLIYKKCIIRLNYLPHRCLPSKLVKFKFMLKKSPREWSENINHGLQDRQKDIIAAPGLPMTGSYPTNSSQRVPLTAYKYFDALSICHWRVWNQVQENDSNYCMYIKHMQDPHPSRLVADYR